MIRPRTIDTPGWTASLIRLPTIALLCGALTGCAVALLPAIAPQVAMTVGVAGMTAASCSGESWCEPGASLCSSRTDKKIEVKESHDIDVPSNEGKVAAFTPAYWQSQFASDVTPRGTAAAEAAAGTFVVTDKSILFVPSPGTEGLRLPLAGVLNVEVQQNTTTGAPRQLTVESCFGRLDRFAFGQSEQPKRLDSKATANAATEVKARLESARTPASK